MSFRIFRWCTEIEAKGRQKDGYHVVSCTLDSEVPWCILHPSYQHTGIGVPGYPSMISETVTGIWEGLKLQGPEGKPKINFAYFSGPGRERTLKQNECLNGWSLSGRPIGLVEARRKIFIPAYVDQIKLHCASSVKAINTILSDSMKPVYVYDEWVNNDVDDTSSPLSHASIFVAFMNGSLAM